LNFTGVEDLSKKFSFLKRKAEKGVVNPNQPDTSQANRGYNTHEDNLYQGTFEHGRYVHIAAFEDKFVFELSKGNIRALNNAIAPRMYGLDGVLWAKDIRICTFVFNTKGIDDRPRAERTRYSAVLDIGFCDAQLPLLAPDYTSAKHFLYTKNSLLGRWETKKVF